MELDRESPGTAKTAKSGEARGACNQLSEVSSVLSRHVISLSADELNGP